METEGERDDRVKIGRERERERERIGRERAGRKIQTMSTRALYSAHLLFWL